MQTSLFPELPVGRPTESLVLLLGNIDHEGITSALKSSGEQYKKKVLNSTPDNWESIIEYFEDFIVRSVIVKLNARVYDFLARPEYADVASRMFDRIAETKHAVFVFEDLLSGNARDKERRDQYLNRQLVDEADQEDLDFYRSSFGNYIPATKVLEVVNTMLRSHRLNLIPYRRNAEVTVAATQILKDTLEGLLFRIYVPTNRLWANEVDKLLQLFRDFLLRTGRQGIRLDQVRTDHGISYEFHGDESPSKSSLSEDFQDFSTFLDLCVSNPDEAESLLVRKSVNPREIAEILTRYSKEAKRLQIDLRHDRERKLLNIRQRLESELADMLPNRSDWVLIDNLVSKTIPEALNIAALTAIDDRTSANTPSHLTINLRPQIVNTVKGIVSQEIQGDVNFSEESETLLRFIEKFEPTRTLELSDSVRTLSDEAIPSPTRLISAQKLKAFVFGLAGKIGSSATTLLVDYLEKKAGLK